MTVTLNDKRKAFVLSYDIEMVDGETADLLCQNPADLSDVSTREGFDNDGNVVVTFPMEYSGETNVSIVGSDGGEDTGVIQV